MYNGTGYYLTTNESGSARLLMENNNSQPDSEGGWSNLQTTFSAVKAFSEWLAISLTAPSYQ